MMHGPINIRFTVFYICAQVQTYTTTAYPSVVMQAPDDGEKWLKHVAGILCSKYKILLYTYVVLVITVGFGWC